MHIFKWRIMARELSFLFHKFFPVDKSRKMNYGGIGLGLS